MRGKGHVWHGVCMWRMGMHGRRHVCGSRGHVHVARVVWQGMAWQRGVHRSSLSMKVIESRSRLHEKNDNFYLFLHVNHLYMATGH